MLSSLLMGSAGEIALSSFLLVVGIILIVKGGDWFVDAASWIAEISGLSPLLVGATVVSVATTLPELIVSIIATSRGSMEIAVGNAVGSVVANLGLIMAISLFFMPGKVDRKQYAFKSVMLLVAAFNLFLVGFFGEVKDGSHVMSVVTGVLVLELFILFIGENILSAVKAMRSPLPNLSSGESLAPIETSDEEKPYEAPKKDRKTILTNIAKFILGAGGIIGGAELLVIYGQKLALSAGVPEGVIAVTLVAVGTSLPELVTTISAIAKKKSAISVGNIIGANILDLTMILPICAMVSGGALIFPKQAIYFDLPFCLGLSAVAVVPMLFKKKFYRWQGVALLMVYITYLTLRIIYT